MILMKNNPSLTIKISFNNNRSKSKIDENKKRLERDFGRCFFVFRPSIITLGFGSKQVGTLFLGNAIYPLVWHPDHHLVGFTHRPGGSGFFPTQIG
jgi:hypothetical protein